MDFTTGFEFEDELLYLAPTRRMTAPLIHNQVLEDYMQVGMAPADYELTDTPIQVPNTQEQLDPSAVLRTEDRPHALAPIDELAPPYKLDPQTHKQVQDTARQPTRSNTETSLADD